NLQFAGRWGRPGARPSVERFFRFSQLVILSGCNETPRPIFVKILIAPDKFKGSLSAVAVAEAISAGFRRVWPEVEITHAPIADGGEGFADALRDALGGEWITTRALDPIGREVDARYAWVEKEKLAIIDMSEASGLWRLKPEERAPLQANTYGTG